jgi:hypothetical protein
MVPPPPSVPGPPGKPALKYVIIFTKQSTKAAEEAVLGLGDGALMTPPTETTKLRLAGPYEIPAEQPAALGQPGP